MAAYRRPPAHCRVICIDELGPLAVKTYPAEAYVPGGRRATFEPDYGRRGKLWVHGAFEPVTGEATLVLSGRRDSKSHIQLLEQVIETYASPQLLLIEDNLSTHKSREVQIQYLPKYASWLNLIEPWW